MKTERLAQYLDTLLQHDEIPDDSLNGLQVENRSGTVTKIGVAVDFSTRLVDLASLTGVNFIIVHHGLLWKGKVTRITGTLFRRIAELLEKDIALFASHLPLDLHPKLGNNSVILKKLGWKEEGSVGEYKGLKIGKYTEFEHPMPIDEIELLLTDFFETKPITKWYFGKSKIKRAAIISGKAISLIHEIKDADIELLITGEPAHAYYWVANELAINVLFYGHYTTEKYGVIALAEHIKSKFNLDWQFFHLPTGL